MPSQKSNPSVKTVANYENNPFLVSLNGVNTFFEKAKGIAIFLIVVGILSFFTNFFSNAPSDNTDYSGFGSMSMTQWLVVTLIVVILVTAAIFIGAMVSGIGAYTSARLARGKSATLPEAFHAVLERFFSYIWLQIIIIVKTVLWTLLLIIPGIVMSVRYSLANVAFFDKELRGNAAIKESIRLTENGWITTYASLSLFNLVTFGIISDLIDSGSKMILYRQFVSLKKTEEKPSAHVLSWLTLLVPPALIVLVIVLVVIFIGFVALLGMHQAS